jgi:hypothetical protein
VIDEPLKPDEVRRLVRQILRAGRFGYSGHAKLEMFADGLTTVDCVNVVRGGVPQPGELEKGSWRYRIVTDKITVVVAFRSEDHVVVVTAWRAKP